MSFNTKIATNLSALKIKNDIKKTSKSKQEENFTSERNKKIARTRRQRGYNWEDTLVKRFNALEGWKAFRLGSPSVALPDILAVSTKANTIFTIEAKSGTGTTLHVPYDQIIRCLKWIHTFELYKTRKTIIAFKFLSKKRISTGQYEHRQLREFYKVWDESNEITDFVCTYEGDTYALVNSKRQKLVLENYQMPFQSKHQNENTESFFNDQIRSILMSFEDFVDERSLVSHDALGTKEIKIKLLEVEDDVSDHNWKFGVRIKVKKILVTVKHLKTQQIEEGEFDLKEIEKEMKEKRHYSSTNRWIQTTDVKNGYILSTRHTLLISDAVALDYMVIQSSRAFNSRSDLTFH